MKILLVADVVGGVRTFVAELAREFAGRGADVHLALLGPQRVGEFEHLPVSSCEVRDLRLEWMEDPWADVEATGEWVAELTGRHRPDVVHMNTFAPVPAADVPVLLTVHSCVLTWWRAVHGRSAPPEWDRYRALARRAFDRAELVSAPTRALLDELIAVYGALPAARVIPNGRNVGDRPRRGRAREPLVVSVGRLWDGAKNAALLGQVAGAIKGRMATIGPGAVEGIESLGSLDEAAVLSWLDRASVFAEPARYEPFGLAALEAALCGCALVLGDIPSLREVWGKAATFVGPDDPDALVYALNSLLADRARCRRAAHYANLVARHYSPAVTAELYLEGYEQLLGAAVAT